MLNLCHLEQSENFPHPGSVKIWQQKIIFDPVKKCILGHQSFCIKLTFEKNASFCPKNAFFLDKNVNLPPSHQVNLTELHISKDNWFTYYYKFQITQGKTKVITCEQNAA